MSTAVFHLWYMQKQCWTGRFAHRERGTGGWTQTNTHIHTYTRKTHYHHTSSSSSKKSNSCKRHKDRALVLRKRDSSNRSEGEKHRDPSASRSSSFRWSGTQYFFFFENSAPMALRQCITPCPYPMQSFSLSAECCSAPTSVSLRLSDVVSKATHCPRNLSSVWRRVRDGHSPQ